MVSVPCQLGGCSLPTTLATSERLPQTSVCEVCGFCAHHLSATSFIFALAVIVFAHFASTEILHSIGKRSLGL